MKPKDKHQKQSASKCIVVSVILTADRVLVTSASTCLRKAARATLGGECVTLTAVCGSVWLSCLLVGVEVGVEVEVEGLQWPSLPALGRRQGQGGGSSAGLSTHERMLCRWVRTTAHTSHTHTQHAWSWCRPVISLVSCISQKHSLKRTKYEGRYFLVQNTGEQ